jgi:tetratricopeptide (TPR) repeat protein
MKKIIIALTSLTCAIAANAQNMNKIKELIEDKNFAVAKTEVDALVAKPDYANKAEVWYYKGVIENALSADEKTKMLCKDCKQEAFASLQKYVSLDAKMVLLKINQGTQLFELYNGFLDEGNKAYTANNIDKAYDQFNKALQVHDYIGDKKIEREGTNFGIMDTGLMNNVAICAMNSGKNLEAIALYKKLIDTKAATQEMGNNCSILASNTFIAGAKTEAQSFNDLCKIYFKNDDPFYETEMMMMEGVDKKTVLAKYDAIIKQKPNSYRIHFNYLAELFNYIHGNVIPKEDKPVTSNTFVSVAQATNAIQHTPDVDALLCKHYYNTSFDYQETANKLKGTDKESLAKKATALAAQKAAADECIKYGIATEAGYAATKMSEADMANLKSIYPVLKSIYAFKNDAAKVAEYKAKEDK